MNRTIYRKIMKLSLVVFFWLTVQEKKTCSDFAGGFPVTADEVTITVYGAVGSMVCTRKKIKNDDKSKAKVSLNRRPAA